MLKRPRGLHLFLFFLLMMIGAAQGQQTAPAPAAEDFQLTLESRWMYGPVNGHLQTPSGGRPGTTSHKRPSLEELGIDTASIFDGELRATFRDHGLYLGGQWVRWQSDEILDESLLTQGRFITAGSEVAAEVKMDWYRLGYRHRIQRGNEPGVQLPVGIYSRVGVAMLDFRYQLDASGGIEVDRQYMKPAMQMGVEMEWHASEKFSIAGELTSTLPFTSWPWIVTASVVAKYDFVERRGWGVRGYVGAAYEKIGFEDDQEEPNDLNVDFGPMVVVGLELRF
jgi:hypothetical protein